MASLSLFQDGVSGVHKITRYNDEGLKRRENSLISFPLEIIKRRRTAAIFSLNKDGGVFNGTMYILFALSYKNALRITFDLFVVGNLLYEYRKESFLFGSVTNIYTEQNICV
jgi:hypothetical protein